ncbi:Mpr protein [Pilimelia anulata]|uniref:Mpr protein n=1 Tax=Pilimelia anulata TaxID=53371 RepID=A0A8J3BHM7_9ACTN|nr:DUF4352 domain-containing protein [Pilimelia anulata]GGK04265.1 Mpr protein [Pilimelia anulata]
MHNPQQSQPTPHPAPPPPAKKRKTPWLIAGGAVLVLCCGGGIVAAAVGSNTAATDVAAPTTGEDGTPPAGKKADSAPKKQGTPGVGAPVRDGKFEFVITAKPACGKTTVGPELLAQKAQGVYCFIPVKVRNIGKESQMFTGANQKATDSKGLEFSNDTGAELLANEGAPTFLKDINPGNSVSGRLVFDVAKGTTLVKIELHDSAFSGGVTVALA